MPYTLKPNKLFVKNPNGEGYLPQNVVTDSSTADQIAAIEAKGAEVLVSIPAVTELSGEVGDLKSALGNEADSVIAHSFELDFDVISGGITATGDSTSNTARARTTYIDSITAETTYEFRLDASGYIIINAVTYGDGTGSAYFVRNFYPIANNRIVVRTRTTEKRIRISFAHTDKTTEITSSDIATIKSSLTIATLTDTSLLSNGVPADAKATGIAINDVNSIISNLFESGNNLLPLADWSVNYRGIDIAIKNGILTVAGQSTGDIRVKLSGAVYQASATVQDGWKAETISQFESGKTYSLHNHIVSGIKPSTVGVSLRNSAGSVMVSQSTPEASISEVPAFAMLYIPSGVVCDFAYIPMFVEGGVNDRAYYKTLDEGIFVPGTKQFARADLASDYINNSEFEYNIKLPATYSNYGSPTPLIIIAHGLTARVLPDQWTNRTKLADVFATYGYASMDVDRVTEADWCNPALIKKYIRAISHVKETYNVDPRYIYAYSMGNLIGLCLATIIPGIRACAVSGLRLDFKARYDDGTDDERAIIDANLGFTTGYDAHIAAGWDKTAFTITDVSGSKICPVQFPPTAFLYGTADDRTMTESLQKVNEIKNGGTIAELMRYEGADHTEICQLDTGTSLTDVMNWFGTWV